MALVFHRGGLGDANPPNFVELDNTPDQSTPGVTNYADQARGDITIGPVTVTKKAHTRGKRKAAAVAIAKTTGKPTALKRVGSLGKVLDAILPLKVDAAGKQSIFGLPPGAVYIGSGIALTTIVVALMRAIGGGRRYSVSNPKRARQRRAKR